MKVCENGHIMPENSNFCPLCGKKERVVQKFCSNCGSSLSENDKFCPNCGHQINASPVPKSVEPVSKIAKATPKVAMGAAPLSERVKQINSIKLYPVLLVLSIVCLLGTVSTNIQQFVQYGKVKEQIEKEERLNKDYQDMMVLYEMGLIDSRPQNRYSPNSNWLIKTPYNCLNIPVTVIFWLLAFIGVITAIIVFSKKPGENRQEKTKLQLFSGLALTSILVGVIYWASTFHF